jgi:alpha-glucoside transport system permease protein
MSSKTDERTDEEPTEEPTPHDEVERPAAPTRSSGWRVLVMGVLRVLGALAIPVAAFALLWGTFDFLRDADANRFMVVGVAIVVGVGGVFAMFWGMNRLVDQLPSHLREGVRPYVFVGPALVILSVFLVYPVINTVVLSFKDDHSDKFVGWDNYSFVFTDESMLRAMRNTAAWIVLVPLFAVTIGLVFATLADRLSRGEAVAKSMIFLPMAISFAGAAITFRLIYSFRPEGFGTNIGLMNGLKSWAGEESWFGWEHGTLLLAGLSLVGAILLLAALFGRLVGRRPLLSGPTIFVWVGGVLLGIGAAWWLSDLTPTPVAWLDQKPWNNFMLMVIMIWMQTGFAMVVLSAAIKSIPDEIIEAARIDGASELQVFRRIVVPSIAPTIVVVTTYMVINALKVFDIVFVMSPNAENSQTEVIAERMINSFFTNNNAGEATAIAVILFLAVIPIMIWNVRRFRLEEAIR